MLARELRYGKRALGTSKLAALKAVLQAQLGDAFPEKAWSAALGPATPLQLADFLEAQGLVNTFAAGVKGNAPAKERAAKGLVALARKRQAANKPAPHQPPVRNATFFAPFLVPGKYGQPPTFTGDIAEESGDELDEPAATADFDQDAFLGAFGSHLAALQKTYVEDVAEEGTERDYELATTSSPQRRLMDIAWVLEKLSPGRTCVAVTRSAMGLHIYANAIDAQLETDAQRIESVANTQPATLGGSLVLQQLTARVLEATGERMAIDEQESREKYEARWTKAARRIVKAAWELKALRGTSTSAAIFVHRGRMSNKHAEMRLLDLLHSGDKGYVGISKICCAKCYAAILAARATGIELDVQGAHFNTYRSTTGWPVPRFLRTDDAAMRAFLGDDAFALYDLHRREALAAIMSEKLSAVKGIKRTDAYSSDEEQDAGPAKKRRKVTPATTPAVGPPATHTG